MKNCILLIVASVALTSTPALAAPINLLWTDHTRRGVFSSGIDGSGATEIVHTNGSPDGIAANATHAYWANASRIFRSGLDASGASEIVNLNGVFGTGPYANGVWVPRGVALAGSFVYWTDEFQEGLFRAELDGSNPTRLLDFTTDLPPSVGGDYAANGLASSGTFLYWTDQNAKAIFRSELDGSNPTTLLTGAGIDSFHGIAVNATNLFWVDALDGIFRSDLDGSNVSEIIDVSEFSGGPILRELVVVGTELFMQVDGVSGSSAEGIFGSDLNGDGLTQVIDLHTEFPAAHGNGPRGITSAVVPEPSTALLLATGIAAIAVGRRRPVLSDRRRRVPRS